MNIFHKIALQGLKKNRTRTFVTIIGVILSSVLITGVMTFGVSLLDYMARGAMLKYGDWNAAFLDADASFVQERMLDGEVSDTAYFQNVGYADLDNGTNPNRPYLFIAGFLPETFDALPVTLMSGRLPENDREVLVSAKAMTDGGISCQPGDTISLSVGKRMNGSLELCQSEPYLSGEESLVPQEEKSYTVVGICRTPVFETEEAAGYTLITGSDVAASRDSFSLFVTLKKPYQVYSYVDSVNDGHAYILNYDVLRVMGISNKPGDRVFMMFLYSFGGIVLLIIMVGSVFLIYNSFGISLGERMREIGILASVGASEKQLRNSVLFEGLCIGAVGIPIGILAGLGGMKLVLAAVSERFGAILYDGVSLTMKVSAAAIGGAAAVSLITILISAYVPAKKAVRLPIMACIRQTNEIKVESKAMKISRRQHRMYGLEGTLALKNFKRNRKRYRSIVMSLVLSIVLFVSTNALIASLGQTAEGFRIVSDFDIGFGTQDMEDDELFRLFGKMKNAEDVEVGSCREVVSFFCEVGAETLSDAYWEAVGENPQTGMYSLPMEVHFFDDEFYQGMIRDQGLNAEEYGGQEARLIAVAKINDDSDDVKGAADLEDIFLSDSVDFVIAPKIKDGAKAEQGKQVQVEIMEIVPPDIPPILTSDGAELLPYTFEILAPWSAKEALVPSGISADVKAKGLCFESGNPSRSEDEMRNIIQEEGVTSSYILLNSAEAFEQYRNYIFLANMFAYIFIALISLIAVANVFNTISTNIRLRRRELAMLRSVGMADREFNRMMRFECLFYGKKALVIGIPLSLAVSVGIVQVIDTSISPAFKSDNPDKDKRLLVPIQSDSDILLSLIKSDTDYISCSSQQYFQ